ncbi:MAG: hypothetical protein IPL49_01905 [Saprospirales bacterium]|nr:hypothetical protein [Saprospirales bacterium]MBK8489672.1 hypothetical protein [Saprospirales bacterium]
MKMHIRSGILVLLLSSFLFSSCSIFDADIRFANRLEGEWEVKSFTEDGVEMMQFDFNRIQLEFEKYSKGEGDFTFTYTFYDGDIISDFGEYTVDEKGTNLELTYAPNSYVENWDMDIQKDELTMESVIDQYKYIIKAERD